MKIDKTPEKIYCHRNEIGYLAYSDQPFNYAEEYVNANAFIEKACIWLKENAYFYVNEYTGSVNEDMLTEDFRNYMKK